MFPGVGEAVEKLKKGVFKERREKKEIENKETEKNKEKGKGKEKEKEKDKDESLKEEKEEQKKAILPYPPFPYPPFPVAPRPMPVLAMNMVYPIPPNYQFVIPTVPSVMASVGFGYPSNPYYYPYL